MNFKRVTANKKMVSGKYVIGIDPGDTSHKAIIISPEGIPISKPFGFTVTKKGFAKFEQMIKKSLPKKERANVVIGMESSCNLWQTFTEYFEGKYKIVTTSPLTTYFTRIFHEFRIQHR